MRPKLYIIGAGGHGKVVADAVLASGKSDIAGFADDTRKAGEQVIGDHRVISTIEELKKKITASDHFIIAIGKNETRKALYEAFAQIAKPATVIHPSAFVSAFSSVAEGSVVLAGAVINASSSVGKNCIINSGSLVDHDVQINDHVHVAQGAIIGSNSSVAQLHTINPGAIIPVQSHVK